MCGRCGRPGRGGGGGYEVGLCAGGPVSGEGAAGEEKKKNTINFPFAVVKGFLLFRRTEVFMRRVFCCV